MMRSLFAFLLAMVMLLSGCGVQETVEETTVATTVATEPTTEPTTVPTEPPVFPVEVSPARVLTTSMSRYTLLMCRPLSGSVVIRLVCPKSPPKVALVEDA